MKNKKVLIVGNKPHTFQLDNILDSFDVVYRCNLAWPGNNNGTKFGRLAMCPHVYLNFVDRPVGKEQIMEIYGTDYDATYLSDWYDYFQANKDNFDDIYHQDEEDWNNVLVGYGCPHTFSRMATTGYSTIFRNLSNTDQNEIYVSGFSLVDSKIRVSMGVLNEISEKESEGHGCHSNSDEMNILTWLHNNKKVDASLCLLDETGKISKEGIENDIKLSKFMSGLINNK